MTTDMRVPCRMPPRCDCEPNWTSWESGADVSTTVKHGQNPEATATFNDVVMATTDVCERNHSVEIEEWMKRTYDYIHGHDDD